MIAALYGALLFSFFLKVILPSIIISIILVIFLRKKIKKLKKSKLLSFVVFIPLLLITSIISTTIFSLSLESAINNWYDELLKDWPSDDEFINTVKGMIEESGISQEELRESIESER